MPHHLIVILLEWNRRGIFVGREDERRVQFFNAPDLGEFVSEHSFVVSHVAYDDLEDEVIFAGDVVDFEHFGDLADGFVEPLDGLFFVQGEGDVYKGVEFATEFFGVEDGDVLLDDADLLEVSYSLKDAGCAEPDRLGEVGIGDAPVVLEDA